jgi:ATP-dependent helicase/nuclease subunit A
MERLNWRYFGQPLTEIRGKMSVSELKRRFEAQGEVDETTPRIFAASTIRRPAFITAQEGKAVTLTATETGTATHTVLRHLDLAALNGLGARRAAPIVSIDETVVRRQIEQMAARGLLTSAEAAAVDPAVIRRFLHSPLGVEMRQQPNRVQRELPFSLAVRADEIANASVGQVVNLSPTSETLTNHLAENLKSKIQNLKSEADWVLVQGIIDCLIERSDGFVVLDFKTDRVEADGVAEQAERYRTQMAYYARAVETIFRRPVIAQTLYFLHCDVAVEMQPGTVRNG